MRPYIYLCGQIHGKTFNQANTWREVAEALLYPDFLVLNPLREKLFEGQDSGRALYTDAEIVERDLADIRLARAVLRFYDGTPSPGSDMETFYASRRGIPVVTFGCKKTREELPVWVRAHTTRNFEQLGDATDYLKSFWLLPHEQRDSYVVRQTSNHLCNNF
jgi:hypothetical protein